jgi:hypothetical protein
MTRSAGPIDVAPGALDPILRLVERVDRWRRRIRPLAPGSLLGVEEARYRGPSVRLSDGSRLEAGTPIWVLHFDNARLSQLVAADAWPTAAYAAARSDLEVLATRLAGMRPGTRPAAMGGVTLLAALSRRLGFEVLSRPRTPQTRLEDWYLRSLLARWAPTGRGRLARGHGALQAASTWISTGELLRRYGPPPE